MNIQTINQLSKLNNDFYSRISADFHESRNHFWPGWYELIPDIQKVLENHPETKILDIGCGTARFALFLQENFRDLKWQYTGLDFNQNLLKIAEKEIGHLQNCQVKNFDLNTNLNEPSEIIVCFGVTHHIAGKDTRENFLTILSDNLTKNGIVFISFWQFMDEPERYEKKIVSPNVVGLKDSDLEPNDFILDWKRGVNAFRYCHNWSESEISAAVLKSKLSITKDFRDDSKSGQANHYLVLKKT